jgi:hypothetical protein
MLIQVLVHLKKSINSPHFTDEGPKVQGGAVICLKSHGLLAAKLGLGPTSAGVSRVEKMDFSGMSYGYS